MNIGVNVKKYRAVKEVGKILMSVGVIAYVHQTQVCQFSYYFCEPSSSYKSKNLTLLLKLRLFDPNKAAPPFANQVGNNYMHIPVASPYGAVLPNEANHFKPFHDVEFQTSSICPKNFIIFDQTNHRSQIMFNPEIAHKITGPAFNLGAAYIQDNLGLNEGNNDNREASSTLKEDSDDIDALLSLVRKSWKTMMRKSYGLKTKKERLRSSLEKSSGVAAAAATVKGNARNKRIPSDPWKFVGLKRCVPFNSTSIFKRY
ncbi:hypothetical protein COP1_036522 [Malus domestica]